MKRWIAIVLLLAFCAGFCGCTQKTVKINTPVNFYYRRAEIVYGSADGVIGILVSEGAGYENNLLGLLNSYLRNTGDPDFAATFPTGSQLIRVTVLDNIAEVQLNNLFARASGIELTVACASLSLTVMDLTGTDTVVISAVNATLDGAESVTMTADSLLLLDLYNDEIEN